MAVALHTTPLRFVGVNIAQRKVIWYKKWGILSFRPKFNYLHYIFHIWNDPHALGIWWKHTHWNVYKSVHWYRQKIAQKKVIWYKKWEILSFGPKFNYLHYIFHIWRDPHAPRYMEKTYTLKRVQMCPLVSSEHRRLRRVHQRTLEFGINSGQFIIKNTREN